MVDEEIEVEVEINTHLMVCDFGQAHRGELWTRVPVGYLRWIVNSARTAPPQVRQIATAELKRRGSVLPTLEISGHAIDRASLRCRKTWHQTALTPDEGLHAWLCRVSEQALAMGERDGAKVRHLGLVFVFEVGDVYPVLKTIHPD